MFQNDVFGYGRNNVFGINNPLFGNTWGTTPYGAIGNQIPWHFGTHTPYQMNTQVPFVYNQLPYHLANQAMQNCWNTCPPQTVGANLGGNVGANIGANQGFLPFFGTNLPYQTAGYFGNGINQTHGNFGQNHMVGAINPFFSQFTSTPWGFGSIGR